MSSVTASAELYDPATDTWTPVASMGHARTGHSATLLADGRLLIVGGSDPNVLMPAEIYDPSANTWSPAGTMTNLRIQHSPLLLANGHVIVAGGYVAQPSTPSLKTTETVEDYDPVTNSWSSRC